ncbi:MAG: VOC family protein [Pseudorhodoplanes sp.]|nr:VOC family protein [Pseudorhodoplanes sp.]
MPTPYLMFNGRCEEALNFYKNALGAEIGMMMRFKENPDAEKAEAAGCMPGDMNKIMHSAFQLKGSTVMASDGMAQGQPKFQGFSLSVEAKDEPEAERFFNALAEGGKVEVPLTETFFAKCFGMVADKFGVSWMVIVSL